MKNIIILNSRGLHFYDFVRLRKNHELRVSAVVFKTYYDILPNKIKESLDKIHILNDPDPSEQNFPPFPEEFVSSFVENDLRSFVDTRIVSSDEINALMASYMREKFRLPGSTPQIILNYRDKGIQIQALKKAGIRTPKYSLINIKNNSSEKRFLFEELVEKLGSPFILKPVDMFGSLGVRKINTYEEFSDYFSQLYNFSNFVAEELIRGQLYHCDFIIKEGKYIFAEVCEYIHNGLSFVNGLNHGSLILLKHNSLREPIINFCRKANTVLGLTSGCAHFEVFVTKDGEITFLEAAARPAGSMVPLVFTKTFNNNYLNAALLAEIEENPDQFIEPKEYYFWAFFPKKNGYIKNLRTPPFQSPYEIEWFAKVGDILNKPCSIAEKVGSLLVKNKDYEALASDFYSLRTFDAIEIEKDSQLGKTFL